MPSPYQDSSEITRPPEIQSEYELLEKCVRDLEDLFPVLSERLKPVLRTFDEISGRPVSQEPQLASPLGQRLHDLRCKLDRIGRELHDIYSRLEI